MAFTFVAALGLLITLVVTGVLVASNADDDAIAGAGVLAIVFAVVLCIGTFAETYRAYDVKRVVPTAEQTE